MVRTALMSVRKLCSLRRASAGSSLYGLSGSSQRRCTDAQSTPAVNLLDERISPPPVIQNSNGDRSEDMTSATSRSDRDVEVHPDKMSRLNLEPLSGKDIPDPQSDAFQTFLDGYFARGEEIVESMSDWPKKTTKVNGTVKIVDLPSGSKRDALGLQEYWCGRVSTHKQSDDGGSLYEQFREGLLHDHSKHEQEYIEAMSEAEQLEVYRPQEAEVWRLTFITPAPTNPRTFVVLLLCRELATTGQRRFMNVSIPFSHPKCPEKVGSEKKRVRGKYVSVECVKESDKGVEWLMATSSDAGGNIPRFMTNSSLPSSIAEDVPSFLQWLRKQSP